MSGIGRRHIGDVTGIARLLSLIALGLLSSCSGVQSTLAPAGAESASIFTLLISMVIGAVAIWFLVIALMMHASKKQRKVWSENHASRLIAIGGVAFPVLVLAALLAYAVWLMPGIRPWVSISTPKENAIAVTGEQFWWRIRYPDREGLPALETANELRLPVNVRSYFSLEAADVIHSFWIPSLGGKMDMIPGRTNVTSLLPTKTGVFRAPCAEFCGTSHALMAFSVVVMEQETYAEWRRRQAAGHQPGESRGARLFSQNGCAACHAIGGTQAAGKIGPDLTFLGARQTIGAGTLANTPANIARFIKRPSHFKPGARMPDFDMLPDDDVNAIAAYLWELQ